MRHVFLLTFALVAILPAQAMGQAPKLEASLLICMKGSTPPERSLAVSASMPALAANGRMWMRFELYQKRALHRGYKRVKLPAWKAWTKSNPAVPGLIIERMVDQLASSAYYKVKVRFRWYDSAGKHVKSKVKTTSVCRQPPTITTPTQ